MPRCITPGCGSYAINHGAHGRDGSDGDLCDVCYWRKRAPVDLVQTGWLVETQDGPYCWPLSGLADAERYCEDDANPVPMYSSRVTLEQHRKAQEGGDAPR